MIWKSSIFSFLVLYFAFLLFSLSIQAQNYSNDWIDYQAEYYPIKIAEDGIYRISYNQLASLNLVQSISSLKLFALGQNVPIYLSSESDGLFGADDYVEFYARRNNGDFDSQLFSQFSDQIQKYRSLFNDTLTYFLSVNAFEEVEPAYFSSTQTDLGSVTDLAAEPFLKRELVEVYNNVFNSGLPTRVAGLNANFAQFEEAEGFVTPTFGPEFDYIENFYCPHPYLGSPSIPTTLSVKLCGRSDDFTAYPDHHIRTRVNGLIYLDTTYEGYESTLAENNISQEVLSENMEVKVQALGDISDDDKNAISYIKLEYPALFNFDQQSYSKFNIPHQNPCRLSLNDFNTAGDEIIAYDLCNQIRNNAALSGNQVELLFDEGYDLMDDRQLLVFNPSTESKSLEIGNKFQFTNYLEDSQQGNYIILTHPKLMEGTTDYCQLYSDYRSSEEGGNFNSIIVDINELYKQFAYGIEKHPLAIRNFINFATDHFSISPDYVLLLGKSVRYNSTRFNPNTFHQCLVPSFGNTPSDNVLAARNNETYSPQLAISRIPASTPEDVAEYLEKLIKYEQNISTENCNLDDRLWLKNVVNLSQGSDLFQAENWSANVEVYKNIFEGLEWGANVGFSFNSSSNSTPIPSGFANEMESGISVLNYFGHGLGDEWELDISDPATYNNEGKYPLVLSASCFTGNLHTTSSGGSMAEKYILEPNKGSIGFLSSVSYGVPSRIHDYQTRLISHLTNYHYGESIGKAILYTIDNLYSEEIDESTYKSTRLTCEQITFAGDPALKLHAPEFPDFVSNQAHLSFHSPNNLFPESEETLIVSGDVISVDLGLKYFNLGKGNSNNFRITVKQVLPDESEIELAIIQNTAPYYTDSIQMTVQLFSNSYGTNKLEITLDSNNQIEENCEDNNTVSLPIWIIPPSCSQIEDIAPYSGQIDWLSPTEVCSTSNPILLETNQENVIYVSDHVNQNNFDPSNLKVGQHQIPLLYLNDSDFCINYESLAINVVETPEAEFIGSNQFCEGGSTTLEISGNWDNFQWSNGSNEAQIESSSTAPISVMVSNTDGCFQILETTLEEIPIPIVNLSSNIFVAPSDFPFTIEPNTEPENLNFVWSTGETSPSITITEPGSYNLTVSNDFGCTAEVSTIVSTLSVGQDNQIYRDSGFEIWQISPNPVSNTCTIYQNIEGLSQLKIINSSGQTLHQYSLKKGSNKLNLKQLKPGLYIFQMNTLKTGEMQIEKIIKQL